MCISNLFHSLIALKLHNTTLKNQLFITNQQCLLQLLTINSQTLKCERKCSEMALESLGHIKKYFRNTEKVVEIYEISINY